MYNMTCLKCFLLPIPRRIVVWLCKHTGGHEQMPGEVGYAGGAMKLVGKPSEDKD
jgi:hypothetical protein